MPKWTDAQAKVEMLPLTSSEEDLVLRIAAFFFLTALAALLLALPYAEIS